MKLLVWDAAATVGKEHTSLICREVDRQIDQLSEKDELFDETRPDSRIVRRIIDQDIQELSPDVVVKKLPPHTWYLRDDYEEIKQLAQDTKAQQEGIRRLQEAPATSLRISLREIGGSAVDLEGHKGGQLVAFTLGNCSDNILTIERICLEVVRCQPYRKPPRIEARVMPLRYQVELSPSRLGEYLVTEERFRYGGRGADDFDLVCDSPPGYKYNARLNVSYSDLFTGAQFPLSSAVFDLCFYKEGDVLSPYIRKGYDIPLNTNLQRRKHASSDDSDS